ncbi:MAG: glucosamine-6-phosphate deaminase [bacterium]|nr:glucosamine-6-phosphate deaminase [bacterium]MDE0669660.1 glucosamine-6-phosphate deaminase [bacterium]MYJ14437.1 glucosamine-6-phosphate deaminase [Acidimicrobiia bacterium]
MTASESSRCRTAARPRLHVVAAADELASVAADVVQGCVATSLAPRLGLATGGSVAGLYGELIRRHRQEALSFAGVRAFLLDEYLGLPDSHPKAYRNVIRRLLADHVDFVPGAVAGPDASASDLEAECDRYDRLLAAGVDLQILGIGRNGHIAFNEPGSPLDSTTRVVRISEATRRDNARFFDHPDEVPRRAITEGIGTILRAAHLLLIATGESKAAALRAALEGPVAPQVPASALQLHHSVTVVADRAASAELQRPAGGR